MSRFLSKLIPAITNQLNDLLKPAEDPRQAFIYTYKRQKELMSKVQGILIEITFTRQRLEAKTADLRTRLPYLEQQARHALQNGQENQARLALQQQQMVTVELQTLEQQMQEVAQEQQRVSLVEQQLASQIEAFYARQEAIATRYNNAESQVQINKAIKSVFQDLAHLEQALEQAEQKTSSMEARAEWVGSLVEAGL
jgi:phage shock protein A